MRHGAAPYAKLSPGPGRSAGDVASHQCARIHAAMIEIVGERGYAAVTVRELTHLAGVSTRAFYEHFDGKEDCFLHTYALVVQKTAAQFVVARKCERGGWMEGLRAGSVAYARELERQPRAARLALVEALTAGPAALKRMRSAECMFETLIAESLSAAPGGVAMPRLLIEGITAGIEGVARGRLMAGREGELPGLVDELHAWAISYRDGERRLAPGVSTTMLPLAVESTGTNGEVLDDKRERILSAVAKLAAVDGYERLTVSGIRSEASVSRRCFESHFDGVPDCFLSALEQRVDARLSYVARAAAGPTWANSVHRAIFMLCVLMARDPALARLAFIEVFAPGLEGVRCRERLLTKIARLFRASAPPHQRPSEVVSEACVNAVWGVIHHRVAAGRIHHLPQIVSMLSFLALAPTVSSGQNQTLPTSQPRS